MLVAQRHPAHAQGIERGPGAELHGVGLLHRRHLRLAERDRGRGAWRCCPSRAWGRWLRSRSGRGRLPLVLDHADDARGGALLGCPLLGRGLCLVRRLLLGGRYRDHGDGGGGAGVASVLTRSSSAARRDWASRPGRRADRPRPSGDPGLFGSRPRLAARCRPRPAPCWRHAARARVDGWLATCSCGTGRSTCQARDAEIREPPGRQPAPR